MQNNVTILDNDLIFDELANVKTDLMETDGYHLRAYGYDFMTNNWLKTLKSKVYQSGNRFLGISIFYTEILYK